MTYKELQQALRPYKEEGQTDITLNSPKPILEAEFERLTVTKNEETECHKCDGAGTVVGFDWSDMSYPDVPCEECGGTGYIDRKERTKTESETIKAEVVETEGKISQHDNSEDEPLYNREVDDELEDKVDEFLLAVKRQKLSSEQLEAIALAMVVGNKKHQAMSTVLANYKKFHLFSPNQLLAWGFDQIIPGTGLFQQFRRAIKSSTESDVIPT